MALTYCIRQHTWHTAMTLATMAPCQLFPMVVTPNATCYSLCFVVHPLLR